MGQSGVQQHHRDQHAERHERDHEEQNEVPPVTSSLDRARRLVGQLRQVDGQGGEVVQVSSP